MSRIRANKITNKVGTGAIELEKGAHLPVGMGITGAGAINISGAITGGVITGSSFSGDGSGLIGVASTDNIITGTAATFNTMPVDINAGMTVAGVSTFGAITATSFGAVSGTTGTFSGNVSVGGVLTYEDVTNVDSVGIVTARSGIDCNADLDVDGHTNLDNVSIAGVSTFSGNINLPDSVSAVFGTDSDGSIKHTGTNLQIFETTGNIQVTNYANDKDVDIKTDDGSGGTALYFKADGSTGEALLYHYGNEKIKTTTTGINVTGTITADGLDMEDNQKILLGTGDDLEIFHDGTHSRIVDNSSNTTATIIQTDHLRINNLANTESIFLA